MAVQTITLPAPTSRRSGYVQWRIPFFGSGSFGLIDTDLIQNDETAYLVELAFNAIAGFNFIDFQLDDTDVNPSGGGAGPSLTSVMLSDGTITLAFGGASVEYGNNLFSTDTSEPYRWTLNNAALSNQLNTVIAAIGNRAGATLTIDDGQLVIPPEMPSWDSSPPASQAMQVGKHFSYTVPAAKGHPMPAYAASGLPAGLTFDTDSLIISGTPTAAAEESTGSIVITAMNDHGSATFTIAYSVAAAPPPPPVTSGDGVVVAGDSAGGAIQNSRSISSTLNGSAVAVAGDDVASHAPCPIPASHCAADTTASPSVTINGIAVVVNDDPATCGHPAVATNRSLIG